MTNHPDSENSWGPSKASVNSPCNLTHQNNTPYKRENNISMLSPPSLGDPLLGIGSCSRAGTVNKKLEMTPFLNEWIPNDRTINNQNSDKKNLEISELIATKVKNDNMINFGFGQPLDIDIENPMLSNEKDTKDSLCSSDKEIFREGFIYKKNSTGGYIM